MTNREEITDLIKKMLDGDITPQERDDLHSWAEKSEQRSKFLHRVLHEDLLWEDICIWFELEFLDQEVWNSRLEDSVLQKISQSKKSRRQINLRLYRHLVPYAAAILIITLFSIGVYHYRDSVTSPTNRENMEAMIDIEPGKDRASLTLADGRIVELSGEKEGIVMGSQLTYADGAAVTAGHLQNTDVVTISVPRGGKYQVTLSDGTAVWLNADSKLKYPIRFTPKSRVVELEGEAYFDVAKMESESGHVPFLVKSATQTIEVLGTQFNLKAYGDEVSCTTTLVEGSVLLKTSQGNMKLKPGEQGIYEANELKKTNVNVEEFAAWKDNKFVFNETPLSDAMAQISRWYDIEVIYKGSNKQTYFYGEISRTKKISEVLAILKEGGVTFNIEKNGDQKKLIVSL
ncbi:FecR domain-containing protein [Sphingobacterium sp. DN00404]|uniref:FecR domain-containing protein n=1 Tax=Sphingobacterium micropteri TaxID=2763501 RepID=A0ABR7YMQ0_9SPHI|nr:FecR family protein [Sphingobacterium micropteri]MBD1432501.1 FecR domain-containing protein [Sphingobacterium micropteri]